MTRIDAAEMLEKYASRVIELPGVSRLNPHAFAEAKSELVGEMMNQAKELRTVAVPARSLSDGKPIAPGTRTIGHREIRVETRRRTV